MLNIKHNKLNWTDINMAKTNLDKLVLHFCQCMKAEGKSPATIRWYSEMIRSFVSFLLAVDKEPVLGEFTLECARDFIIHEQERQVSPYTVQTKARALKGFSSWLFCEGYIVENVLALLKIPKAPIKLIKPLTTEEINLLVSVQNPLTAIGSRNLAILITFLGTGIRESELSNLRDGDSHIEEGYVKVMGKGSKERVVPLGAVVQKILWRYIFHFRPEPVFHRFTQLPVRGIQVIFPANNPKVVMHQFGVILYIAEKYVRDFTSELFQCFILKFF